MWNDIAQREHGVVYSESMPSDIRKSIRDQVPFVVSESENTDHEAPQ